MMLPAMLLVLASFSERRALRLERPVPTAGGEASGAARQAASAARGGVLGAQIEAK